MNNSYRVLIFGEKVFFGDTQNVIIDNTEVIYHSYPSNGLPKERLATFDFIIMDYEAFSNGGYVYEDHQDLIEKQLFEALDQKKTVVFLHYNVKVPEYDQYAYTTDNMDRDSIKELTKSQIGFRFLRHFKIHPIKNSGNIHTANVKRSEFQVFRNKWGSSKNIFLPYKNENSDQVFSDVILSLEEDLIHAFALDFRSGKLIYLPAQRNFGNHLDIEEMYINLIQALITYNTKTSQQLPDWLKEPLFGKEKDYLSQLEDEKMKVQNIEKKLVPYNLAKRLLSSKEYELENVTVSFFKDNLGLNIFRYETYKEDFWLLDEGGDKITICEVKSYMNGFKRSGISYLNVHREEAALQESFPAILIVNQNLQAKDIKEKTKNILPQDAKIAAQNNILILRVEDLLFMWEELQEGRITKEFIQKLLTTNKGWLCFNPGGSYKIYQ